MNLRGSLYSILLELGEIVGAHARVLGAPKPDGVGMHAVAAREFFAWRSSVELM
ncbi:MAG: hypothetical protein WBX23_07145 [Candidatus Cybelea sp.]